MKIKILIMCLVVVIIAMQFVSCSSNADVAENSTTNITVNTQDNENSDDEQINSDEASEDIIKEDLPEADYGGYDFNVLVFENQVWSWAEIIAEEETGEAINDAFYRRNRLVEEKLNINIKQVATGSENVPMLFRRSVDAGDNSYDVAFMRQQAAANVATSGGYCLDLNDLSYVDFDKPWWDKNAFRDLSFGSTNYIAASEITVGDYVKLKRKKS